MNTLKNAQKMWRAFVTPRLVVLTLLGCLAAIQGHQAMAAVSCSMPPSAINLSVSGSYTVGRDVPVGTILTPWTSVQSYVNYTCMGVPGLYMNIGVASQVAPTSQTVSYNGLSLPVFATNVQGIGYIVQQQNRLTYTAGGWDSGWLSYAAVLGTTPYNGTGAWSLNAQNYNGGLGVAIAFVKTGNITPGAVSSFTLGASYAGSWTNGANGSYINSPTYSAAISVTSSLSFTTASCTTPDVTVPLGTHLTSELKGVGTYTSATNFNINVNNCPAKMGTVLTPAIQYTINPTTAILNSTQSVVALDSTSTASGMGIQLLNNAGTAAAPLNTTQTLSSYNSTTGGSYTIPLSARYYQTGATVTPGTANTTMTVTMTYY